MTKFDRLEDVTPKWRTYFEEKFAQAEKGEVRLRIESLLPERVDVGDLSQTERIAGAVRDASRSRVRDSVMPACLSWLRVNGYWPEGEARETRALNELKGALDGLTPFEPRLPPPVATVKNLAWVIPAAAGAAIGSIAMTPLSFLLFNSREVGLFAGAILGAAGLVALVATLATKPEIVGTLETGMKWVGFIALPIGLWRGMWGRPTGWIRAAVYTLASWLLLGTVRPRTVLPSRAEVLADLDEQVETLLLHDADLVLAWFWAHPDRLGPSHQAPAPKADLSGSVCDALGTLHATLADRSSRPEDLADAAEALLQRVVEEGYEWKSIAHGTPYDMAMGSFFSKYGMIDIGQPVETLKPAIVRNGIAVQHGVIRRLRV